MVVVGDGLRTGKVEVARRPFGAEPALEVEFSDTLAQHTITRVRPLIEIERVTQSTLRPVSIAERVLVDEKFLVQPAIRFLHASLELRLLPQRARVVCLRRQLTSERVVAVDLTLNRRTGGAAILVLRLTPQEGVVLVA